MWKALGEIAEDAWQDALDMPGAQIAETIYTPAGWNAEPLRLIIRRTVFSAEQIARLKGSRRLKTIDPDQLQFALDGQIDSVYGYSFILTDIHWQPAAWIEHFHRHRAQAEERLKDAKLGQALRHLPSRDEHANRVWLTAALLALNLTAFCCDVCPAAGASTGPDAKPQRRHAKTLRKAERVMTEPALEVPVSPLLLRVRGRQCRVDINDDLRRAGAQLPRPRACLGPRRPQPLKPRGVFRHPRESRGAPSPATRPRRTAAPGRPARSCPRRCPHPRRASPPGHE
jgi:hypothetical protein